MEKAKSEITEEIIKDLVRSQKRYQNVIIALTILFLFTAVALLVTLTMINNG